MGFSLSFGLSSFSFLSSAKAASTTSGSVGESKVGSLNGEIVLGGVVGEDARCNGNSFGGSFFPLTEGLDLDGVSDEEAFSSTFLGLSNVVGVVKSAGSGDSNGGKLLTGFPDDLFDFVSPIPLENLDAWSSDLLKLEGGAFAFVELFSGLTIFWRCEFARSVLARFSACDGSSDSSGRLLFLPSETTLLGDCGRGGKLCFIEVSQVGIDEFILAVDLFCEVFASLDLNKSFVCSVRPLTPLVRCCGCGLLGLLRGGWRFLWRY